MALTKQKIDLQLQGLDTKSDAKHVLPGRFARLENVRFAQRGRIDKAPGHENATIDDTDYASGLKRIYGVGRNLLGVHVDQDGSAPYTGERLISLGTTSRAVGSMAAPKAWTDVVLGGFESGDESSRKVDSCYAGETRTVFAILEDSGVRVIWYDTRKRVILADVKTDIVGDRLRVLCTGTLGTDLPKAVVAVHTRADAEIVLYGVVPEDIGFGYTGVALTVTGVYDNTTDFDNSPWDWAQYGTTGTVYLAHASTSGTNVITKRISVSLGATGVPPTATLVNTSANWSLGGGNFVTAIGIGCALPTFGTQHVAVAAAYDETLLLRTYTDLTLAAANATVTLSAGTAGEVIRAVGIAAVKPSSTQYIAWNVAVPGDFSTGIHNRIRWNTATFAGSLSAEQEILGYGLVSKPYVYDDTINPRVFVAGAIGLNGIDNGGSAEPANDEQTGYVILDLRAAVGDYSPLKAKLLSMEAGPAPASVDNALNATDDPLKRWGLLVNLHAIGDPDTLYNSGSNSGHTFGCAVVSFGQDLSSAFDTSENPTLRLLGCSFNHAIGYHAAEFDGGLLVTGGVLQRYDGRVMRENGFLVYPTIIDVTTTAGGSTADGTYSGVFLYERIDSQGKVIRSAVSPPVELVMSGGGGTGVFQIHVTGLRATLAPGEAWRLVGYVTRAGSTSYRRAILSVVPVALTGPFTVLSEAYDEVVTVLDPGDPDLASSPAVYTDGGELDHWQPDAPIAIAVDKDRAYVVEGDDRESVLVSKPLGQGEGLAFFAEEKRVSPSDGGPITALAHRDGNLLAFKRRHVFAAIGDGPDAGGLNNTLGELELLHQDVGAIDQRHVLKTTNGTLAVGAKGIWMVGRDLSRSYVGADVEQYAAIGVLDTCYVPDRNEARILVASLDSPSDQSDELVWNDEFGLWSVNPDIGAIALAARDTGETATRHILAGRGSTTLGVFYESHSPAIYTPNSSAGVFTRANYPSDNNLYRSRWVTGWIQMAGINGFQRVYEIVINGKWFTFISSHRMDVRLYYDYDETVTDDLSIYPDVALGEEYQGRVLPSRQKCKAIKIEIYDNYDSGLLSLSGISLVVGIKGPARFGADQTAI
jgi:hypothetical protein